MDVDTAARDLGKLIAQTPEYKYYSQAAKEVDEDSETSELLTKVRELEQKLVQAQQQGEEVSEELKKDYTELMQQVQGKTKVQSLIATQENYMKMMDKVNQSISEGIKEGAESRIITNF